MLPTKFRFIWPCGFRVEDFQKSTNQKKELPVVAMFVNGSGQNEHSLQRTFLPSFGSFGKAISQEKIFINRPIRNKNCLWQPYLLMDRDERSNLYRRHPIDASYQVSVHLTKRFQRRRLKCEKLTDDRRRIPIRVITKLPNSEQSYKGKVKTHKYINRQNQSTTGKL